MRSCKLFIYDKKGIGKENYWLNFVLFDENELHKVFLYRI